MSPARYENRPPGPEPGTALPLAREYPVELTVNGTRLAVFLCTPEHLDELAAGNLFTRGSLRDPGEIRTLGACPDLRIVAATTKASLADETLGLSRVIASGCGGGLEFSEDFRNAPALREGFSVELSALREWARAMFEAAVLYRETGGMHCACLAGRDGRTCIREDVGRHNAVDKVIGRAFLDRWDFSCASLLTSGRIAADMILKAAAAGIPVVATRSIPTTTAYEIARLRGITVVGRIESKDPILYTRPDRIIR